VTDGVIIEHVSIEVPLVERVSLERPINEIASAEVGGGGNSTGISFTQTNVVLGRATAGAGLGEEIPCNAFGRSVLAAVVVAGSLLFAASANAVGTDNSNLFWDDANNRLGIGTVSPKGPLHVHGYIKVGGNVTTQQEGMIVLGDDLSIDKYVGLFRGTLAGTIGGANYLVFGSPEGFAFCIQASGAQLGAQAVKFSFDNSKFLINTTLKLGGNVSTQQTGMLALGNDLTAFTDVGIYRGTATGANGGGNYVVLGGHGGVVITASNNGLGSQTVRAIFTTTGLMQFEGQTGSFPALKRSGAALHTRLADDSAFADFYAANAVVGGYIEGAEMTAPAAPAANGFRLFAQDNGAGKTQLMALFASGAAQQIAIEP
jgi:hypothetical protein